MNEQRKIFGKGSAETVLDEQELRAIVRETLAGVGEGRRVLAVIPDTSRDDNTSLLFPLVRDELRQNGVAAFDALVAQGTHPPITEREKRAKIGLDSFEGRIFDHEWNNPSELVSIGRFDADEISAATQGAFAEPVELTINRRVEEYDTLLVLGATVPHEVAGFAGGAKYFFPGISGPDLTHATHWIGALAGIEHIIGRIETPTRHLIERAADRIPAAIINFTSVVTRGAAGELRTHALFAGDFRASFRRAAAVSRRLHVKYVDRRYRRVVALLDRHYTELWTGGKASYKLGGIIEDGGELVIYAPHLAEISLTHAAFIERFGYAPIEKVKALAAESEELRRNLCVAAHLAHVSYAGRAGDARAPKYRITMASGLSRDICERVNLHFADHTAFDLAAARADADTLVVENAGRDLYLHRETNGEASENNG